jgi:hypothetical protein
MTGNDSKKLDNAAFYTYLKNRGYPMINDEFTFYDTNQDAIVKGHLDEFVVIKDQQVCGYYKTEDAAFDSMIGEELGTFMVKCCKEPGTDIIEYFNNAVAFA